MCKADYVGGDEILYRSGRALRPHRVAPGSNMAATVTWTDVTVATVITPNHSTIIMLELQLLWSVNPMYSCTEWQVGHPEPSLQLS